MEGSKQEKTYRDEFSWDQLEEDEFGRLRTVVRAYLDGALIYDL